MFTWLIRVSNLITLNFCIQSCVFHAQHARGFGLIAARLFQCSPDNFDLESLDGLMKVNLGDRFRVEPRDTIHLSD